MFAIVCLICVLGAVVFVFHGTQTKLSEVQKLVNSCNQQQESLSAQLQVIFEYKVRLEKSLTKEKEEHKQTKETLESKLKEEKSNREKEALESKNKYDALLQQNKFLQNELHDLKENEKKTEVKYSEENQKLQKELDLLRKENGDLSQQKDHELEELKSEYLKQQEEIRNLAKENDNLKARVLPEKDQRDYFEKQNLQNKEELEKVKKELLACEESKNSKHREGLQPDTNVLAEMPKVVYGGQKLNGSTTPGLNPEAVNNFEVSSPRPLKDVEQAVKKIDEQVGQPPKKPTQESIMPLALPRQGESDDQAAQIPEPGNGVPAGHDPLGNTLHKPNTGNLGADQLQVRPAFIGGQGEPYIEQQPRLFVPAPLDNNRAEEEDQKQGEIPRIKNGDNYHGADYEREQPDDEEDDEGEQLDYDNERAKKEQKNMVQQPMKMIPNREGESVMVNPK